MAMPFALFANGQKDASGDDKPVVIGVALMSLRHPFFQSMQDGMEAYAKEKGVVLRFADADFDLGKQSNQVKDFVIQKVDAILVTPLDAKGLNPTVNAAVEAGIPVVCVDTDAPGSKRLTKVASDNYLGGQIAAGLMMGALDKRGVSDGVIVIATHAGVTSTEERNAGFKDVMAEKMPGLKIEVMDAIGQRDKAMNITEDAIQRFGDSLVGVFGVNDDASLGALSAVERMGLSDKISVVGYDAGDESKAAIKAGKIVGNTIQFPGKMGSMAIQVALDYLSGTRTEFPEFMPVEVGTYTPAGQVDMDGKVIGD
jgi:ribose transport system substrate-binding protein